jgi:phage protein
MNKKELIDYCNAIKENKSQIINCIDVNGIIKKIEQLDEPEKVKVPQFVAEHIEWTKEEDFHLLGAMSRGNFNKTLEDWFYTDDNMETFARAWLDGYEVEKEPKYTVKFKATNQYLCDDDGIGLHISPSFRSNFRKSDLEKLSLTEVFDSSLFEVEEVE